ncbi:hypothetical protein D0T53_12815 [Dysgonomonas sp. 216]|uniref:rhamnogalacturonan lyase family protein n=1 Tax=Dysgonomonas sp. 216 TaxID=2302934 RepID=UPI0013D5BB13|nr:autotransporter-associated beta strand repeat-containing protein [Dysgonomonas sp. 216]NDW19781.1 hypothetical protein [Dysgonomonas sp. 216]
MKQLRIILCFLFLSACVLPTMGQRKMETMDRGVIAIAKSSNQIYISWRHFATDPDDIAYNVYYKTSPAATSVKLNSEPITNSTNFTASLAPNRNLYFLVKSVVNGVEQDEPGLFHLTRKTKYSRIVKDFDFEPFPQGFPTMSMKFCWPVDLNGDGKYDFVLDRQNYGEGADDAESEDEAGDFTPARIEAYTSEGVFMWRVNLGYNLKTGSGQAAMITAYDMNNDGKAEVLMAVSEGTTFPDGQVITAKDGTVTNYKGRAGSAPQWVAILDGETGCLIDTVSLPLFDEIATTRSDKWKDITGHFMIAYLDGINPALVYQYKNRQPSGGFTGAYAAWTYADGKLDLKMSTRFYLESTQYEFHQVRVADVDGDGKDEIVEGSYTIDDDGSLLYHADNVYHGDRHVLADIDPDRPGLEHFFIQQSNIMGMGIFDAATGETIKGLYMSSVNDVGRGTCAAFDPTRRGLQFFSTMNGYAMYDAKGKLTDSKGTFPSEALWWGADLSRRHISSAGNDKNPTIDRYNTASKSIGREVNLYHEDNGNGSYYFRAPNGGRAAFWGDLFGDWREELIYTRTNNTGFVIVSTWDETPIRQYTLMQNPAYRCQTTTRGYYQTADVDFYMAADMPAAPVSPIQKADMYYDGSGWIDDNNNNVAYTDGKSIMFDIRGGNSTYTLNGNMSPSRLWLINPKGGDYTFNGTGKFTGSMDVVKSLQGDVTFNGDYDYTGITRISEGRLFVNGTLASKVQLDARAVIGGNATLNGGIVVETGLNVEGGRIEPGVAGTLGKLKIVGNLDLPGRNNFAFDVDQTKAEKSDLVEIQGNFNVTGTNHSIVINPVTAITAGTLTLITYTGTSNATPENFKVKGLEGIPFVLKIEDNSVKLEISEPRTATNVNWMGGLSNVWDFQTENFINLTAKRSDIFVPGDNVLFSDAVASFGDIATTDLVVNETMPVGGLTFTNELKDYSISGDGIISGTSGVKKTGAGKLSLLTEENTFTGGIEFEDGILEVASLKNGGLPSSIGASSADASNWVMKNATLQTTAQMATDRNMTVEGKLTVNNPAANTSVLIGGNITGTNIGLELKGKGTLSLQGNNTFTDVTVKDGILSMASVSANSKSLGSAKITMEGGILQMYNNNSSSTVGPFTNEIYVPEGASATWNLPQRWRFENKLTGSGTITINVPYVRSDFNGDWSAFAGTIKFTGSDIRLNNATARNIVNADVDLGSGTTLYVASNGGGGVSGASTITFGGLSGSGKLDGKNTYNIGDKGSNTIYSGVIGSGTGKLVKRGTGSLTLSAANEYTGTTTINGGRLIAKNTTGSATGSGGVIVNSTSMLLGTGTIQGVVSVNNGGAIMPGLSDSSIGTLSLGSSAAFRDGSNVVIKVNGTRNDVLKVGGSLTLSGTLEMKNLGSAYKSGASYTIFNVTGTISGNFTEIVPAIPGEGLMWDTSRITEGIISVKLAPVGVNDTEIASVKVYPTLVDDICYVSVGEANGLVKVELLNSFAQILQIDQIDSANSICELNMQSYASGMYLVKISEEGKSAVYKVIKK